MLKRTLYSLCLSGAILLSAIHIYGCGAVNDNNAADTSVTAEAAISSEASDVGGSSADRVSSPPADGEADSGTNATSVPGSVGDEEVTDYSDADNWMLLDDHPDKEVDLFYIYPTVYGDPFGDDFADVDDSTVRMLAQFVYSKTGSSIGEYTNVYAPYYRQVNLKTAAEMTGSEYEEFAAGIPLADIYAALDTYFAEYNNGRPFILAGHSQGSCLIKLVLGDYLQKHPAHLKRMVAAYALGFSITEDWLAEHPNLKFAERADDTGVIISWNTEGPGNKDAGETLIVEKNAISINPITWTRDDTKADAGDNLGSRDMDLEAAAVRYFSGSIATIDDINSLWVTSKPGIADAQIDLERGTVICTTSDDFNSETDVFGPESFHSHDYDFYYYNIMENAKTRIDAYLKAHGSQPAAR